MTEVSKRARYKSTSPLRRVPIYGRLFENIRIDLQEEPTPKTLTLDQIQQIEPLSAAEAAQLKQPFERIGVDFDFAVGDGYVELPGGGRACSYIPMSRVPQLPAK